METKMLILSLLFFTSCKWNKEKITITSNEIILGDNIDIDIKGLEINKEYEVFLTSAYSKNNIILQSNAIFKANKNGEINVDKDKSIGGNFLGQDSLGLFYTLDTTSNYNTAFKLEPYKKDNHKINRKIHVLKNNKLICSEEFSLTYLSNNVKHTHIEEGSVYSDVYIANKSKNIILIFGGSEGRIEFANAMAKILSTKGYNTAAVSYFGYKIKATNLKKYL